MPLPSPSSATTLRSGAAIAARFAGTGKECDRRPGSCKHELANVLQGGQGGVDRVRQAVGPEPAGSTFSAWFALPGHDRAAGPGRDATGELGGRQHASRFALDDFDFPALRYSEAGEAARRGVRTAECLTATFARFTEIQTARFTRKPRSPRFARWPRPPAPRVIFFGRATTRPGFRSDWRNHLHPKGTVMRIVGRRWCVEFVPTADSSPAGVRACFQSNVPRRR